jgi:cytochrome c peroxidase
VVSLRVLPALAVATALLATSSGSPPDASEPTVVAEVYVWELPSGFPVPLVPADNPMTPAKIELGRRLFHDARLSGNGKLACSGCHLPELAYTDGRARAVGALGDEHPRSAMSLANVAYASTLGWDDPTLTSLEDQVRVPMLNEHPVEMGVAGHEQQVLGRLRSDRTYRRLFDRAFPESHDPFTLEHVARALASFERTLISGDSPYDRWAYRAEVEALTTEARAGATLFFSRRLACFRCHAGSNLSGNVIHAGDDHDPPVFHNTPLYNLDGEGAYPGANNGVHRVTGRSADMGKFRAPTLRNIALTAPYMHDGSLATLEEVLEHYAAGGRAIADGPLAGDGATSPLKDALIAGFELSAEDRAALIAFLNALTDESFVERARSRVP